MHALCPGNNICLNEGLDDERVGEENSQVYENKKTSPKMIVDLLNQNRRMLSMIAGVLQTQQAYAKQKICFAGFSKKKEVPLRRPEETKILLAGLREASS